MVRVRVRHPMADLRYGGPESMLLSKQASKQASIFICPINKDIYNINV